MATNHTELGKKLWFRKSLLNKVNCCYEQLNKAKETTIKKDCLLALEVVVQDANNGEFEQAEDKLNKLLPKIKLILAAEAGKMYDPKTKSLITVADKLTAKSTDNSKKLFSQAQQPRYETVTTNKSNISVKKSIEDKNKDEKTNSDYDSCMDLFKEITELQKKVKKIAHNPTKFNLERRSEKLQQIDEEFNKRDYVKAAELARKEVKALNNIIIYAVKSNTQEAISDIKKDEQAEAIIKTVNIIGTRKKIKKTGILKKSKDIETKDDYIILQHYLDERAAIRKNTVSECWKGVTNCLATLFWSRKATAQVVTKQEMKHLHSDEEPKTSAGKRPNARLH